MAFRNIREVKQARSFTATVYRIYTTNPEIEKKCPGILYIGSTKMSLKDRFSRHLTYTRNRFEKGHGIHQFMAREGIEHFAIESLEELDGCVSRDQMLEMEEEIRQILKPVFNMTSSAKNIYFDHSSPFLAALVNKGLTCTC